MNKVAAIAFTIACLVQATYAQISPLPPSCLEEGIVVQNAGLNLNAWQSSCLIDYQHTTGNLFHTPTGNLTDVYGRSWTDQAPSKSTLIQKAGTVRTIFLGTDTDWTGAVGYTYSGNVGSSSYTTAATAASLCFGTHVDISMGLGVPNNFDLWLSGNGNTFCLFQPGNSEPAPHSGSVRWLRDPLLVSTYIPALATFMDVETWIASVDEPTSNPDNPSVNYRLAVQLFYPEGRVIVPVPEPSTYGIIAGCSVVALALWRRRGLIKR